MCLIVNNSFDDKGNIISPEPYTGEEIDVYKRQ